MTTTFVDLCAAYCAEAQTPMPELMEHSDGVVAMAILWRDVAVQIMAQLAVDPAHAFITFEMGKPDPAHIDYSRILEALLYANHASVRGNPPVFGCDPQTGMVTLRWAIPLQGTTGADLQTLVEQGVGLVLQWRQTFFLSAAAAVANPAPVHDCAASYA